MTLGLTDGKNNFGLKNTSSALATRTDTYGLPVGSTASGTSGSSHVTLGVSTNSAKSGLIAKLSGVTLGTVASKKLGNFYIKY